jgi:hypothetical protein
MGYCDALCQMGIQLIKDGIKNITNQNVTLKEYSFTRLRTKTTTISEEHKKWKMDTMLR